MYFGFQSISDFSFIGIGFLAVALGAMGFVLAFILGPSQGGRTALRFTRVWAAVVVLLIASVILYAVLDGQWRLFLLLFGFGPLLEMGVLSFGWIVIMWFMAHQYSVGRITLDEKFGSSKQLRKEAIEAARQAQQEVYRKAQQRQVEDCEESTDESIGVDTVEVIESDPGNVTIEQSDKG